MYSSKITSKGQVTIPKAVREKLDLNTGDTIFFSLSPDHLHVLVQKVPNFLDLAGTLTPPEGTEELDWKEIRQLAWDRAVVGRYLRTLDEAEGDDKSAA